MFFHIRDDHGGKFSWVPITDETRLCVRSWHTINPWGHTVHHHYAWVHIECDGVEMLRVPLSRELLLRTVATLTAR